MMTIYHYAVVEKPEARLSVADASNIDMENLDYKRQIDPVALAEQIKLNNGAICGMWRGGMFGLATNQIAVLSAWPKETSPSKVFTSTISTPQQTIIDQTEYTATVRPDAPGPVEKDGFHVIRWIRMEATDITEYTSLCLETWPAFEAAAACRCYGVFRPRNDDEVQKLLMLTWYGSLDDWEKSRTLEVGDKTKWARRSEMELSHWADGGRPIDLTTLG